MNRTNARDLQRILMDAGRLSAPTDDARERVTAALRARLGTAVVPEGLAPAARAPMPPPTVPRSPSRVWPVEPRWLGLVASTGIVAAALGFALGYGMGRGDVPAQPERDPARATPAVDRVQHALEPPVGERSAPAAAPSSSPDAALPPSEHAHDARELRAGRPGARPRSTDSSSARPSAASRRSPAPPPQGAFAEVLERLRRAQVALKQGQASLALILLAELDRSAGDVLREEREVTRVLALCAAGDTAAARRAAEPLRRGSERSIYAPRLDASCAPIGER